MYATLRDLLPLLVVGCLLLQSLQPTAVSGQEVCDQTIEGSEAIAFEDYVWEYSKPKRKLTDVKKHKILAKKKKKISVSYYSFKLKQSS